MTSTVSVRDHPTSSATKCIYKTIHVSPDVFESVQDNLPAGVVELLSIDSKDLNISVKTEDGRYWWIASVEVCLLIDLNTKFSCLQLQLPKSSFEQSCDLMTVETKKDRLGFLALTREGRLRYWQNLSRNKSSSFFTDTLLDLKAEFKPKIVKYFQDLFFVGMGNSSVMILSVNTARTPVNFEVKMIVLGPTGNQSDSGIFSSFSRRFSSMFSSISSTQIEEFVDVAPYMDQFTCCCTNKRVYAIAQVNNFKHTKLAFYHDVKEFLPPKLLKKSENLQLLCPQTASISCLGFNINGETLHFLLAASSNQYNCKLILVTAYYSAVQMAIIPLKLYYLNYAMQSDDLPILPRIYFYQSKDGRTVSILNDNVLSFFCGPQFEINYQCCFPNDKIFGAGYSDGGFNIISSLYGFVCLMQDRLPPYDNAHAQMIIPSSSHLHFDIDLSEPITLMLDAFSLYLKHQEVDSCRLVQLIKRKASVNQIIAKFSFLICDHTSSKDPRWSDNTGMSGLLVTKHCGASIKSQLHFKFRLFEYFIAFLKATKIWKKDETFVFSDGTSYSLGIFLSFLYEKLRAMMALFLAYSSDPSIIDSSDESMLNSDFSDVNNIDFYFLKVSKLQRFLQVIYRKEPSLKLSRCINEVMKEIQLARSDAAEVFGIYNDSFIPWTVEDETCMLDKELSNYVLSAANSFCRQSESEHVKLIVAISENLLLDFVGAFGKTSQLDADCKLWQKSTFQALYNCGFLDKVLPLAKKYKHFETIIEICDKHKLYDELSDCTTEFADEEFVVKLHEYLLKSGRVGLLFSFPLIENEEIQKFLLQNPALAWIEFTRRENYLQAYCLLKKMVEQETALFHRKKLKLALCKLFALITHNEEELEWLKKQEQLIAFQDDLPSEVMQNIDSRRMSVFEVEFLIEAYCNEVIHRENKAKAFYDAMVLTTFLQADSKKKESQVMIFAKCLLSDRWKTTNKEVEIFVLNSDVIFIPFATKFRNSDFNPDSLLFSSDDVLRSSYSSSLYENGINDYMLNILYDFLFSK